MHRALADARRSLAEAEQENRRLHDELALMERSAGLRLVRAASRRLSRTSEWISHPLWSAGTLVRRATARPLPSAVRALSTHLLRRTQLLRLSPSSKHWTDAGDEHLAIRWIGPITIRHRTLDALLCRPNSAVEYDVMIPSGSRFAVDCGVLPDAWDDGPPSITFEVRLQGERGWTRAATVIINVSGRIRHRRWVPVRIALPDGPDGSAEPVVVTLKTSVAPGTSGRNAQALWGEPRFERRRPAADVRRSVATFVARSRTAGVRDALRLARGASEGDRNAELYARWVAANTPDAEVVVIRGLPIPIDQERQDGFDKGIAGTNVKVLDRQFGNWNRDDAFKVMQDYLTKYPKIDVVWCQDDDMAVGVLQAIEQAGRSDIKYVIGGAGSKDMIKKVIDGDKMFPVNVLYPPSMVATVVPRTSKRWTSAFHAMRFRSAVLTTEGGWAVSKSPSTEAPNILELIPEAWAPTTALSMPPYRPSQMRPNLSTRKL